MFWYMLIILFTLFLLWVLLGPVILSINTKRNRYGLMLPGVVKASIDSSDDRILIRGWIFFIPFKINPFSLSGKKRDKKDKALKKRKKSNMKLGEIRMLKEAPGAFRIRKLSMDIDTGDFPLNAWLVPAFSAVNNGRNIQMQINFEGNIFLDLDMRTRIGSLVWILIRNRLQSHY